MKSHSHSECPICSNDAVRLQSKAGPFWKCQNSACGKSFRDSAGKLAKPETCPKCGNPALSRFASRQKPGAFFWRCDACAEFFGDVAGKPAAAFADEETAKCPTCDGQATRRVYVEGLYDNDYNGLNEKDWHWHCDRCGNFRDVDGQIGAPCTAMLQ